LDILRSAHSSGLLASLDVTGLFTNVPTEETLGIIAKHIYSHPTLAAPPVPKKILLDLLRLCTFASPFRAPDNKIYRKTNGAAMGCPLGTTFAEYYMREIENRVLSEKPITPELYCRYVYDIFVDVRDEEQLTNLRPAFEMNSVLKLTSELGRNRTLPFLDIVVQA
jgi:hypothetical protein